MGLSAIGAIYCKNHFFPLLKSIWLFRFVVIVMFVTIITHLNQEVYLCWYGPYCGSCVKKKIGYRYSNDSLENEEHFKDKVHVLLDRRGGDYSLRRNCCNGGRNRNLDLRSYWCNWSWS